MHHGRVQQIDDPVTLYSRPANVFVADFIGSGTLIPGIAEGAGLSALGRVLPCHAPAPVAGPAVVMLRPESTHLTSIDDASRLLDGTVVETHFYGGSTITSVRVSGLQPPVVVRTAGAPRHSVGEQVGISWAPADAVLLAADDGTLAADPGAAV